MLGRRKIRDHWRPHPTEVSRIFRALGRFINSLEGRYIAAEDVNVTVADINHVAQETRYVVGTSKPGGAGDPSSFTALGVYQGIRASIEYQSGSSTLRGFTVAVQGCGAVGRSLCRLLHEDGAKLVVADINSRAVDFVAKEFSARVVSAGEIHRVEADVFAPCALGGVLNEKTILELQAPIVAGGANNQLLDELADGNRIKARGILYAPDYVINAGWLINVAHELSGYSADLAQSDTRKIYQTLLKIYDLAQKSDIPTNQASDQPAQNRIQQAKAFS